MEVLKEVKIVLDSNIVIQTKFFKIWEIKVIKAF